MSVIIPTFNRAGFVGDAVMSVLQQEGLSDPPEILVVDDASTDGTSSVLQHFAERIRCISLSRNHGRNRARNTGLENATGQFVKFLDSDDVLEPGSLRIELLRARETGADIVVSGWQCVEIDGVESQRSAVRFDPPDMEPILDRLLEGRAVPTSGAIYSREMLGNLRWDEELRKLDDWDWFIRAALRARQIARADVVSYSWRQHSSQGIRSETMLRNAQEHHTILRKLEVALSERGELTAARKRRLAQYFYKEMRVLSLHDRPRFEWGVQHIYELDASFVPKDEERQWWMSLLCRVLGVRYALLLHSSVKRAILASGLRRSKV